MKRLLTSLLFLLASLGADAQSIFGGSWYYPIGQTAIPFIEPSSGTMGNNGTLTMTTALQTTYANAYIFMPAGAIAAASLAGWYFGQCSSATVCTLFNNTYASGTPTIPGSPTAFVTTGPGAYTQTTSEIAAYEVSVPANILGPNGRVEGHASYSIMNDTNAKTLRFKVGTQGAGGTAITATSPTASASLAQLFGYSNRGVTNSQTSNFIIGSSGVGGTASAIAWTSLDTTQVQWVNATFQLANATDYIVMESVQVYAIEPVP